MSQFRPESSAGPPPDLLSEQDLPPPPQQERSQRKRQELLDAALMLFQEMGYEAATIEDIAGRANVAVGSFYQHFRSKQQLLLVLMDRLLAELGGMDFRLSGVEDKGRALEQIVRNGLSVDWTYAGAYRAWREAIAQNPDLFKLNRQITAWTTARILDALWDALQLPDTRKDLDKDLDIETMAWVLDQLFWQLAGTPTDNLDAVVSVVTHLLYHAVFID